MYFNTYNKGILGGNSTMKKFIRFFAVVLGLGLVSGAGVGLALSQKAPANKTFEMAEAASSSSYTMTARELLAAKTANYNDTVALVDGNLRVTATVVAQFNIAFNSAETSNFGKLSRNATSFTLTMKVSAASEIATNVLICRYSDGSTNKWIYKSIDLSAAEAGFIDVTFAKPEDLVYFEVPTFQASVVGAYVDIQSCRFDGLTAFTVKNYTNLVDGWNHGQNGGNAVLFRFNDTLGANGITYTNWAPQIADKVTINGVAICDITGGKISYDHGGKYFWVQYSEESIVPTAEYPNTILEIKDGTFFENSILSGIKVAFNQTTSLWEDNAIFLYDIIQDAEYTLFTVNSTDYVANTQYAYYSAAAMPELPDCNFGVQLNAVAETDDRDPFYIRFGSSLAGNDFVDLVLDPKGNKNLYIRKFNGTTAVMDPTVKAFEMTTGVTYKIEFYSLKDSESTVTFILGINGKVIFKTESLSLGATPVANNFFCVMRGTNNDTSITFSECPTTNAEAIQRFGKRVLHTEDIPFSNNAETNACLTYYGPAKAYYTNRLSKAEKLLVVNDGAYADLKARLVAWGAANGENITFNASTGAIVVNASNRISLFHDESYKNVILIVVLATSLAGLFTFLYFYKKKKAAK